MSRRRCLCPCHEGSIGDRKRADGVDVCDAIEAAVACDTCRNAHCAVLSDTLPVDPTLPSPPLASGDATVYLPPPAWSGEEGG